MGEEPGRVINFKTAASARRPAQKQNLSRQIYVGLFLLLIAACLLFGLDGRLVTTVARFVTSAQCTLETHADRLFPSPSGRRTILPCELER
jgi:uncharacterized membrane protein YGL010W